MFRRTAPPRGAAALLILLLFALLLFAQLAAAPGLAAPAAPEEAARPPVALREWKVPWPGTRPRDPFAVRADAVWFVGQLGHYLARLDPQRGRFDKVDLPDAAGPHNLVVDEAGVVWYAGNANGTIGRYDPGAGADGAGLAPASAIERIRLPEAARDPHTLVLGPEGALWFTVQAGNLVGRLDRERHAVELVSIPTPNARPYGIVVTPEGVAWVALFGTNKLARIDPETLTAREYALPRADARPRRIDLGSDGRVWYVDYAGGFLGAYDPAADRFREWPLPSGPDARPYALAVDDRDRIWLVETGPQPNRFVGFDPRGGADGDGAFLGAVAIASGAGAVRHMHFHAPTRSIWFGTDADTIGRARLDPGDAETGG